MSPSNGLYANGVAFHSPGFAAKPRTLGYRSPRGPNPNGVLQMRDAGEPIVCPLWIRHERWAVVQPRWGKRMRARTMHVGAKREPRVRGVAANPGLWNITPLA